MRHFMMYLQRFLPASRGLFSVVFAELTGANKRDLCPESKQALIQPPTP